MAFLRNRAQPLLAFFALISICFVAFQNCGGNIEPNQDLFSSEVERPIEPVEEDDDIVIVEDFNLEPEAYLQTSGGPGIQEGAKIFLVSDVEGTQLTYQWYFLAAGSNTEVAMSGATAPSIEISSVSTVDEGNYWVEVSSPFGGPFVSNVVPVQLEGPADPGVLGINFATQPSSTAVNVGSDATFTVEVTSESGAANYVWQRRYPDETTWSNIGPGSGGYSGQRTNQLTILGANAADVAFYRVYVDNNMTGPQMASRNSQQVLLSVIQQRMQNQTTSSAQDTFTLSYEVITVKPNGQLSDGTDVLWERYDRRPNIDRWVRMQDGQGNDLRGTQRSLTGNPRFSAYRAFVTNFFGQNVTRRSDVDHSSWYSRPSNRINKAVYRWRLAVAGGNQEFEFANSRTIFIRTGQVYAGGTRRWRWQRQLPSETSFSYLQSGGENITVQTLPIYHHGIYNQAQATDFRGLLFDEFGMYNITNHNASLRGGTTTETSETTMRMGLNSQVTLEVDCQIDRNGTYRTECPNNISYLWQREVNEQWGDLSDSIKNDRGIIVSSNSNPSSTRYRVIVETGNGSLATIRKVHNFVVTAQ